eukprot:s1354_g4.t1
MASIAGLNSAQEAVRRLAAARADLDAKNGEDRTPLAVAMRRYGAQGKVATMLRDLGATPPAADASELGPRELVIVTGEGVKCFGMSLVAGAAGIVFKRAVRLRRRIGRKQAQAADTKVDLLQERWQLGRWRLRGRTVLAPMEQVTDCAFRRLCYEMGASFTWILEDYYMND